MLVIATVPYTDALFSFLDCKAVMLTVKFHIITTLLKQHHDQIHRARYFLVLDVFTLKLDVRCF